MPKNSNFESRDPLPVRDHPLVVQSHLRWDFVWQRPQQILSRLAKNAPVLFIEEPIHLDDAAASRLDITTPHRNIIRVVPRLTTETHGDYDASIAIVRDLVLPELGSGGRLDGIFANAVQWFYTPMPAPAMLGAFNEIGVVYDCMDELAQFRHAPPDLMRRERLLISNADVVFTGGRRLYHAKSAMHDSVHFFGCGVDVPHFSSARSEDTTIPADARIEGPVAGYFGVIDERLDYDLIWSLAQSHPEINIVMVGPTAKVSQEELPHAFNIHWLGQKPYDELPRYVKAFDVCLMPFALNEATEYINPTKTLEYMAAGKPIVSTAVPDVVQNFTPIVQIARSTEEFMSAVIEAIKAPDTELVDRGIEMARTSSWENIVGQMRSLISDAVAESPMQHEFTASRNVSATSSAHLPAA